MAKVFGVTALAAAFKARFPNAGKPEHEGNIPQIFASAAPPVEAQSGTVPNVQAMAIKGFAAVSGKLVWVRAKNHFFVNFETISAGDIVQVAEEDGKRLVKDGSADLMSDADVAAAQKTAK